MGEANRRREAGFMRPLNPGEQIQVDLTNATPKECMCGCRNFEPVIRVFIVSALLSPTGQELMAQQPVLVCCDCKKELDINDGKRTQN